MKASRKEAFVKVYETSNYSQFKTLDCNRQLDLSLVKNIKESVCKEDLLAYNPILVTEKMEVIDGQHRLRVCKDLGHTVYYIIKKHTEGVSPEDCVKELNVNKKNWDNLAYFNFYIKKKDPIYEEFADFLESSKLTLMGAVALFSNGKTSTQQFRRGKLTKDDTNWELALKALNATHFSNDMFNLYLIKALVSYLGKRKRGYTEKTFPKLVEKLEVAVSMHWNCEARYLALFEGKIQLKE